MKFQFHMDRKSLKRLVNALVEERKIRAMKVTIKVDTKEKTVIVVSLYVVVRKGICMFYMLLCCCLEIKVEVQF